MDERLQKDISRYINNGKIYTVDSISHGAWSDPNYNRDGVIVKEGYCFPIMFCRLAKRRTNPLFSKYNLKPKKVVNGKNSR